MIHGILNTEASSIDVPNFDLKYMLYRFPCYCHNCIFHQLQHRMHRHVPVKINYIKIIIGLVIFFLVEINEERLFQR